MSEAPEPMKGSLWRRKGTRADYRVNAVTQRASVQLMHLVTKKTHWVPISQVPLRYQWIDRPGVPFVAPTTVDEEELEGTGVDAT